ncbi:hypothetical protein [Ralstonia flaminis]|jgi:hypothetical protein|uniref:hypothetical protein n=1 Tax=Ralstonia flaminis TaxID=3058597 RepID=UPI00292EF46A|nr:hypothetical protein [Ralstonia sp. LMG 18101]
MLDARAIQIEKQLRLAFPSNPVPTEHRREDVRVLWNEIADTLRVPASKLRPSDRFGTDIGAYFITSEELDVLGDLAARRATQRDMKIDITALATVDDYVKAFAARNA